MHQWKNQTLTSTRRRIRRLPVLVEVEGDVGEVRRVVLDGVLQEGVGHDLLLTAEVKQRHQRHLAVRLQLQVQVLTERLKVFLQS